MEVEAMNVAKQESGSSEDPEIGGMPDEYTKYMQFLNDRQREAACSDITMPLMIVAGPGSGKTSTMVGGVLMLLHKVQMLTQTVEVMQEKHDTQQREIEDMKRRKTKKGARRFEGKK